MDDPLNQGSSPLPGAPLGSQPPSPARLPSSPAPINPPRQGAGPVPMQRSGGIPPVPPAPPRPIQNQPPRPPLPQNSPASPRQVPQSSSSPIPDLRFLDQKIAAAKPPEPAQKQAPPPRTSPLPTPPSFQVPPQNRPSAPVPPPPAPRAPQEIKTSIRTLTSDLEKIKIGQQPSGLDIQKTITSPATPTPLTPPAPQRPSSFKNPVTVGLGRTERSGSISTEPSVGAHRLEQVPDVTIVDTPPPRSRKGFYALLILLLLIGGGLYYYLSLPSAIPVPSPLPTPSVSPSPVLPRTLHEIFTGPSELVVLASSGNPLPGFQQHIRDLTTSGGQLKKLAVQNSSKGAAELSPLDLFSRFLVAYPPELKNHLGPDTIILAFGQREKFSTQGQLIADAPTEQRIVLVSEVTNTASASATLTAWESTVSQALATVFGITPTKAATTGFLTNPLQTNTVRYRNFPFPDRTIDYSIVRAMNGKSYFVLSNSRESTLSTIERLR